MDSWCVYFKRRKVYTFFYSIINPVVYPFYYGPGNI